MKPGAFACLCVVSAILAAAVPASSNETQLDLQGPSAWSTALVSGTVVAASTGEPIRGATVVLADSGSQSLITQADDEGGFRFAQLSSGSYHLSATKPGFLDVAYGQKSAGSGAPGVAIDIVEGQRVERLVLTMPRGGAISGVVLDPYGDPVFGARMTALRNVRESGERLVAAGETISDERGMYRIPVLPPGEYFVKASPPDTGSERPALPVEVYYPGVASTGMATPVKVGLSEERSGIDVALQRTSTHRVTGVVIGVDGRPPSSPLMIALADAESGASVGDTNTQLYAGKFSFPALGPGRYVITVIAGAGVQALTPESTHSAEVTPTDGALLWARGEVNVIDRDIADVQLILQPGMTVSGRVAIDNAAADMSRGRVRIMPAGPTLIWRPIPAASIDARGEFAIAGVPPGRYRFSIDDAGTGIVLRSAIVGDRDSLDFPFEVEPHTDIAGTVLTLTDRISELSGTLSAPAEHPASDYIVIAFPVDERFWALPSRRIAAVRAGPDGRYAFRGLPAGDYHLIVSTDVELDQWLDPSFLKESVGSSIVIHLSDGEHRKRDIRIK